MKKSIYLVWEDETKTASISNFGAIFIFQNANNSNRFFLKYRRRTVEIKAEDLLNKKNNSKYSISGFFNFSIFNGENGGKMGNILIGNRVIFNMEVIGKMLGCLDMGIHENK